jgi:hypothetical protein
MLPDSDEFPEQDMGEGLKRSQQTMTNNRIGGSRSEHTKLISGHPLSAGFFAPEKAPRIGELHVSVKAELMKITQIPLPVVGVLRDVLIDRLLQGIGVSVALGISKNFLI